MHQKLRENPVLQHVIHWAEARLDVRAVILTSTLTNPDASTDRFSDYDIILAVEDVQPYYQDRTWLEDFGHVLVLYRDPLQLNHGLEEFAYITQYEDGKKMDFMVFQTGILPKIAQEERLPDYLDVGYLVLLDKDGLTSGLKPPTYTSFIPSPPSEDEYLTIVELFFHEATYVAKHLWRDELIPAKYNLDQMMKFENLRVMLEWRMEMDHGWAVKTGAYGKGLKKRLPAKIWSMLEETYVGAGTEENWRAMFSTIDLFQRVAIEVGNHLGYAYPQQLHDRAVAYLNRVRDLETKK
jgi:aminoglycoside 6-adenylyltransferase